LLCTDLRIVRAATSRFVLYSILSVDERFELGCSPASVFVARQELTNKLWLVGMRLARGPNSARLYARGICAGDGSVNRK